MSFSAFSHFWNVTKFVDLSVDIQEVRQVADVKATDCNVFTSPRLGISVQVSNLEKISPRSPEWKNNYPYSSPGRKIVYSRGIQWHEFN